VNLDEIIVDPEFEALIPPLSDEEYDQLCSNITAEGVVRDPLVVWRDENILLDGHNRLRFLKSIPDDEFPFSVELRRMRSRERAKCWIIQNQLGRRNLSDGWRYELIQTRKQILAEKGKANMAAGGKEGLSQNDKPSHNTRSEIASELGWGTNKVAKADKVWREAEPEVKEKIKNNEISINQAYQKVKKPSVPREWDWDTAEDRIVKYVYKQFAEVPAAEKKEFRETIVERIKEIV
jgi:ParB-like chromosome segregation protein Spo0J